MSGAGVDAEVVELGLLELRPGVGGRSLGPACAEGGVTTSEEGALAGLKWPEFGDAWAMLLLAWLVGSAERGVLIAGIVDLDGGAPC